MRVLVVVAHADDEVLGVGGTIARHVDEGDEVIVAIAADCRTVRHGGEPALSDEARASAVALGVPEPAFLGYPAMSLAASSELELNKKVGSLFAAHLPSMVYTHHLTDINSDHRAIAKAVMVASRPYSAWPMVTSVLSFETPSSSEWGGPFHPNVFVDIDLHIVKKIEAIECYTSELRTPPHPRSSASLRARAAYWGQHVGCEYAEPFKLIREVR